MSFLLVVSSGPGVGVSGFGRGETRHWYLDHPVVDGCDNIQWLLVTRGNSRRQSSPGADIVERTGRLYELEIAGAGEDDGQTGDLDILENVEIAGAGADVTVRAAPPTSTACCRSTWGSRRSRSPTCESSRRTCCRGAGGGGICRLSAGR